MVPVDQTEHPSNDGFFQDIRSDLVAVLVIVAGILVISAVTAAIAWTSARFGIWPQLHAVTYFVLALSAAVLFVTSVITHIRDDFRAGAYLLAFWAVVLVGMLAMLWTFD